MLKYDKGIIINKPLQEVVDLFTRRELIPQWQPGLLYDELVKDKRGIERRKMTFRIGRRNISFIETTLSDNLPDEMTVEYKWKGVRNIIRNSFLKTGQDQTLWQTSSEFRFSGLMKIISLFMRSGFEEQSQIMMNNFKRFAENARSTG